MALDRFIYWGHEKPPISEIKQILQDYVGAAGTIHNHPTLDGKPWFSVLLPGKPSNMFKSVNHLPDSLRDERWFEVCCIEEDSIDVITREADNFTNALADNFAISIARYYRARLETPCEIIDYEQ